MRSQLTAQAARGESQTAPRAGLLRQLFVVGPSNTPGIRRILRLDLTKNPSLSLAEHFHHGLLASTLALLGLAACGGHETRTLDPAPAGPPVAVQTATAVRDAGANLTSAPGVVEARQRAALAARIPASVAELPFRAGERVAAGAVVARLDDSALRSALAAAEAGFAAAEADRARIEQLLASDAATPRERDQATAGAAAARAAVEAARDSLSYTELRAPFAGRIATRPVDVGDVVSPGTTLIEIEGAGGLEVRAFLPQELAARVQPGASVEVHVDGFDEPMTARIRSVAPGADPGTHRFEVRADLPPREGLRAGLFARLRLPAPQTEARILVPAAAVVERGGLTGVFVVEEGRARLRWVARGERYDDLVEIRAGVSDGESVVLDPGSLTDGVRVEIRR